MVECYGNFVIYCLSVKFIIWFFWFGFFVLVLFVIVVLLVYKFKLGVLGKVELDLE